uniref:Uncharacterized protein n=1 Tax=Anguilla anguilla TaxID=7936 RepID=A0A0E9T453_ANGAN
MAVGRTKIAVNHHSQVSKVEPVQGMYKS